MLKEQLTKGALLFKLGKSYKECKNATELNDYTREERNSRCGFHYHSWNKSGKVTGNQLTPAVNNYTKIKII